MSCDLWNGDVGKLEKETSSKRRFDLSVPHTPSLSFPPVPTLPP